PPRFFGEGDGGGLDRRISRPLRGGHYCPVSGHNGKCNDAYPAQCVCPGGPARLGDRRRQRARREDEVAAVSMGIPLVKTKLLAYAIGAAFGGISGAFLADFNQTVNASQFQFTFS